LLYVCIVCTLRSLLPDAARHHFALPSFPTRRSSDLNGAHRHFVFGLCSLRQCECAAHPLLILLLFGAHPCHGCQCLTAVTRMGPDRKSTRLNSSHVSISYAVFCLKKKTPHERGNLSV